MNNYFVIINGKGGVGKDTLIDSLKETLDIPIISISSIDAIKELLRVTGYNGEKDAVSRKLLSDIKTLLTNYNDFPHRQLIEKVKEADISIENSIIFIHIREPREIRKFMNSFPNKNIKTLLVYRDTDIEYNNLSDLEVEKFEYDFIFNNNKSKEDASFFFYDLVTKYILTECTDWSEDK